MTELTLSIGGALTRLYGTCAASIRRTFAEHIPLYLCALVFGVATIAIAIVWHLTLPFDASLFFLDLIPKFLILLAACGALYRLTVLMRSKADVRPLPDIARWLSQQFLAGDRPGNVFHTLLALTPLMISFAAMKSDIPLIHPFSWDHTFMEWDRFLGFGVLPWRLLQPVLGHPVVTTALNSVYDLWFPAMFGFLFWQAFSARGGFLRMQFLVAFAFEWFIGGNILASVFASAGPCFYGHLASPDPYAGLMHYLHQTNHTWPIWSVQIQDLLWQSYVTGSGAVSGISAMPSMHVTSSALMAIMGWRLNKWLGVVLTVFTALIVIGSVALGWHYAVDSIAGIMLAATFWWLGGLAAKATYKFTAQRAAA